jgi:hypothetical protein
MSEDRKTIAEHLALKEHYIALDQTKVWVRTESKGDEYPWEHATTARGGATYRLNFPVTLYFEAEIEGLTFQWHLDIEEPNSNGRQFLNFDTTTMAMILRRVPEPVAAELRVIFEEGAAKVEQEGMEGLEHVEKLLGTAALLRALVRRGQS